MLTQNLIHFPPYENVIQIKADKVMIKLEVCYMRKNYQLRKYKTPKAFFFLKILMNGNGLII